MEPPPSVPDPMVERVAIAHRYVTQLADELSHDPPTPGVADDLRSWLATEVARGAAALARTASSVRGVSEAEVEELLRRARELAGAIGPDQRVEIRSIRHLLDAHLAEERRLASRLVEDPHKSAAGLAEEYSQNRDHLVYGH